MMQVFNKIFRLLFMFNMVIMYAELIFCCKLPKRTHFRLRLLILIAYVFFFNGALLNLINFPNIQNYLDFGSVSLNYVVIFVASLLVLYFLFDCNFVTILFFGTTSYIVQHLWFNLMALGMGVFHVSIADGAEQEIIYNIVSACTYVPLLISIYFLLIRHYYKGEQAIENKFVLFFCLFSIILMGLFSSFVSNAGMSNTATRIYSTVMCVILLFLQRSAFVRNAVTNEKKLMEQAIKEQAKQKEMYAENIDLLNIKYHDMKHRLQQLKLQPRVTDNDIDDIEDTLRVFSSKIETGNSALDIILSEKSLYCLNREIQLNVIADGACLDFMGVSDIYALFGNALDNAIEAVINYEPDRRLIILTVKKERASVCIDIANCFDSELKLENGLPVTTKDDKGYHGYGTKSMKYIADKYKGKMRISQTDGWFKLQFRFLIN